MKIKKKKLSPEEKAAKKAKKAEKKARKPVKSRVQKIIEKHRVNVARYIKVTNRYERQKLARRQTEQKKDPEKVAKVVAEIAASNTLNPEVLADRHMRRTFSKIRSVYASEELPERWRATTKEPVLEPALANVSARLFSHKLVKMAMNKCINNVRMAIAHQEADKLAGDDEIEGKKARAKVILGRLEDDMRSSPELPDAPLKLVKAKSLISARVEQAKDEELSDDDVLQIYDGEGEEAAASAPTNATQIEGDTLSQPQTQQSKKRKAADSIDAKDISGAQSSSSDSSDSDSASQSDSDSSSGSDSDSDSDTSTPARKKSRPNTTQTQQSAPGNSVFVPSLTAGGYVENSDSEASDLDEEVAPRKNRRGQKARQAIWEKKYKDKAKHLQKQAQAQSHASKHQRREKETGKERDKGWDFRRGAVADRSGANGRFDRQTAVAANGDGAKGDGRVKDDAPIHPSWEAKKMIKAKERVIDQYAGTKITF